MPPHRPAVLSAFLAKIARRLALRRCRDRNRDKRGGGIADLSLEEIGECIPSRGENGPEEAVETKELAAVIDAFLASLPQTERRVFLRRYWYFDSIGAIAERYGFGESKVKMMLKRARDKLAARLEKEGYCL